LFGKLVLQAKAGDQEMLGEILESYRNYLGLLVRLQLDRRLRHKVAISDVVQETFIRAQRYFADFRGSTETELLSWLRSNLATTLVDFVRHYGAQRRDPSREVRLDSALDESARTFKNIPISLSSPSQNAIRNEEGVVLAEALSRMKSDYREVIVLRHLEGMSFPEISRRMGRSVDSVKNLWARALSKLRQAVGEPR